MTRRSAALLARILLGCVLAAASVFKLFAFRSFAGSLVQLMSMPQRLAPAAAAFVILVECVTGLLLLARRSARFAARASFLLFLSFTVVLSSAIVRGIDVPCTCFGVLGLRFPLRDQAIIDLVCASAAFFLIRHGREDGWRSGRSRPPSLAVALLFLLWGSALIIWPHQEASVKNANPVPSIDGMVADPPGRPAVLLLADFEDFGCQLCLDDFLAFCDSLNAERFRSAVGVRLLARRDPARSARDQARLLEGWAYGNGYVFPVSVDSDSLFERSGAGKTSAILLGTDGRLVDVVQFPTGRLRRDQLLRALLD